jgi:CubicO group peptidase (beta-lactamase class C family)
MVNKMKKVSLNAVIVILLIGFIACGTTTKKVSVAVPEQIYSWAYWPTKTWKTATPESQGIDSKKMANMLNTIWDRYDSIDSVLVVRNGYLVLEAYRKPWNAQTRHIIYSCTKSVSSALIGIAIDKGYIKDVNQPVLSFFPEYAIKNLDENKNAMTLEHVLTMTTGLECRDSYRFKWTGLTSMRLSEDWAKHVLDLPMTAKPGTIFEYCNGASFLLTAIIRKSTGMSALSFAEKHLFEPLGISDVEWFSNPQGITIGYSKLHLRPRDMAKIGYLYLNKGMWDGNRIISHHWVQESTRQHINGTLADGYGYQWWIVNPDIYTAIGHQGQFIYVMPKKNMVVVFTSNQTTGGYFNPSWLLNKFIIPATKSDAPMPENAEQGEKIKLLQQRLQTKYRYKKEEYVNKELGFSVEYDRLKFSTLSRLEPPKSIFGKCTADYQNYLLVFIDDVRSGLALNKTGPWLLDYMKEGPDRSNLEIQKQGIIRLSDGTKANYVEISYLFKNIQRYLTSVIAIKDDKLIWVIDNETAGTPIKHMADTVKSLKFNR